MFIFVCLVYFLIFESHGDNEEGIKNNQFILENILKKIKEYNILNSQNNNKNKLVLRDDHDHPIEEQIKAEQQNRDGNKIQLNAPIIHDLNAPG
jgi:hypothetical protein